MMGKDKKLMQLFLQQTQSITELESEFCQSDAHLWYLELCSVRTLLSFNAKFHELDCKPWGLD